MFSVLGISSEIPSESYVSFLRVHVHVELGLRYRSEATLSVTEGIFSVQNLLECFCAELRGWDGRKHQGPELPAVPRAQGPL